MQTRLILLQQAKAHSVSQFESQRPSLHPNQCCAALGQGHALYFLIFVDVFCCHPLTEGLYSEIMHTVSTWHTPNSDPCPLGGQDPGGRRGGHIVFEEQMK